MWILDEPFNALDAAAVSMAQAVLEPHLDRGGMIVMTAHQDVPLRARTVQRIELAG